jgi:transposase
LWKQQDPDVTLPNTFEVSASSAIRWLQRFREDGTCEPMS